MNIKLQDRLFKRFSDLFRDRTLNPSQTAMCWGLEVGDGWYKLIFKMCAKLEKYLKKTGNKDFYFTQVKEKFGSGRFYNYGGDDATDKIIEDAETLCGKTCEVCGKPGNIEKIGGWFYPVCSKHKTEHEQDFKKKLIKSGLE